jgi:hypothetical protein
MNGDRDERAAAGGVYHRVGMLALVIVVAAGLIALGLVLTGIIAEPETVMVNIGRWVFGR